MNRKWLVQTIFEAAQEFEKLTLCPPHAVRLTPEIRGVVENFSDSKFGSLELRANIYKFGIEKAIPKLFGFKVEGWDAEKLTFYTDQLYDTN